MIHSQNRFYYVNLWENKSGNNRFHLIIGGYNVIAKGRRCREKAYDEVRRKIDKLANE